MCEAASSIQPFLAAGLRLRLDALGVEEAPHERQVVVPRRAREHLVGRIAGELTPEQRKQWAEGWRALGPKQ